MGFVRWFASNLSTSLDEEPDTSELGEHNENETFEDLAASGTLVYPVLTEFAEDTDLPGTLLALIWGEGAWHLIGEDSGSPILQDDEVVYYLENLIAEATGFLSGFCKEHAIKSDLDLVKLQKILGDSESFQKASSRRPQRGALAPVEEADSNGADAEDEDTED
jgi:hypothetical protein